MPATRICIVRHGETEWNAEGRVQGQTDIPLSARGLAQAAALADVLARHDFSAIYSSDLSRVHQTAAPAAARLALPVTIDPALRERHYGIFECMLYTEVKARDPVGYARFRDKDLEYDFETGESLRDFHDRSIAVLERLAQAHEAEQILVFTHGGVLDMIYRHINRRGLSSPRDFAIPNAAINWIERSGGEWRVTRWADVVHLDGEAGDEPGR